MTCGVAWLFIALPCGKSLWLRQHRDVRSIGSPPFDVAYPRLDTGTSGGPSPLYRSRHSAMTRPPVERTYSSTFQIRARSVAPIAESSWFRRIDESPTASWEYGGRVG